jgi:hypothetical protein
MFFNAFAPFCLLAATLVHTESLAWIDAQYNASLTMMVDNIFQNGTVIASPSRHEPDYYVFPTTHYPPG